MNDTADKPTTEAPISKPVIKRMRWPFPIIWIVPVIAAIVAGYFIYTHHREQGTEIKIEFADAGGITADQTFVQVHGVAVGKVKSVDLTDDRSSAIVTIRLDSRYSFLANNVTQYWVVRPELSLESISGLNTLVTGPYIEARAGDSPSSAQSLTQSTTQPAARFKGLPRAPTINRPGTKVVLHADRLGEITLDSPVTYRGIQVGNVQDIRLSDVADSTNITVFIWEPYTALVRTNSAFWSVKGADLKGGLFSGIKLNIGSLRSLLTGGIAFATPEKPLGKAIPADGYFILNEAPRDEWLTWKPKIPLSPGESSPPPPGVVPNSGSPALPAPQQKH